MPIQHLDVLECDSFEEDQIESLQKQIKLLEGPTLDDLLSDAIEDQITNKQDGGQKIINFSNKKFIESLLSNHDIKDIKHIGDDQEAVFRSFFYILLLIGLEQKKNYPHLYTLIKEQFYKPNIFASPANKSNSEAEESQAMLKVCEQYFQEVTTANHIEQFLCKNRLFEVAIVRMLQNSIQNHQNIKNLFVYEQLCRKFNIDLQLLSQYTCLSSESECFMLGANQTFYIFHQSRYYFVLILNHSKKSCINSSNLNQSKLENQEEKSINGIQVVISASDQETPKFKNSEAVKYRKKSHKNSFGGDIESGVQYRNLLNLVEQKQAPNKVFSQYIDTPDEMRQSIEISNSPNSSNHMPEFHKMKTKKTFQDIITNSEPKSQDFMIKESVDQKRRRTRKISSSEIIGSKSFNFSKFNKREQNKGQEQQQTSQYENSSKFEVRQERKHSHHTLNKSDELEKIEERQSSQRQSTNHNKSNELINDHPVESNEDQMKAKDRKYSYLTQQLGKINQKQINKRFMEKKAFEINIHQATPNKNLKQLDFDQSNQSSNSGFQKNALRYSQLGLQSENSVRQTSIIEEETHQKSKNSYKNKLHSQVYWFQIKFQPDNWVRKQVVYFFKQKMPQKHVIEKLFVPLQVQPPIFHKNVLGSDSYISNILSNKQNRQFSKDIQERQSFGSSISLISHLKNQSVQKQSSIQTMGPQAVPDNDRFLQNKSGSQTNLKSGSQTNLKSGSPTNLQSNSIMTRPIQNKQPISKSSQHIHYVGERSKSKTKISINYISSRKEINNNVKDWRSETSIELNHTKPSIHHFQHSRPNSSFPNK